MRTNDFAMGFLGKMSFGMDTRKDLFEKWSKMTVEEKVELMNQRMEAMGNDKQEGGGFWGKREFSVADIDRRCEEWLKKAPEEKEAFINERKEAMNNFCNQHHGFGGRGGFGFHQHEDLANELRSKWAKMTDEEKQEFIRKREEMMKEHKGFFDRWFSGSGESQATEK